MTANIQNVHVQTLCTLAAGDESVLQYPLPDEIFGFHAQQSCEKLLKALISSHNVVYPLTHKLKVLVDLAKECQETLPDLPYSFARLEPFAVKQRYDLGPAISDADRLAMRESVIQLRTHVIARILELEQQPTP